MQSTEWTQYNKDRVVTDDSDGVYPVYQLGWFPDYSDPDNYLSPFFRDGNFVNNGYSNKEVNDLIVKQAGEKDESARGHRHLREGCHPRRFLPLPLCLRHQGLIQHELPSLRGELSADGRLRGAQLV